MPHSTTHPFTRWISCFRGIRTRLFPRVLHCLFFLRKTKQEKILPNSTGEAPPASLKRKVGRGTRKPSPRQQQVGMRSGFVPAFPERAPRPSSRGPGKRNRPHTPNLADSPADARSCRLAAAAEAGGRGWAPRGLKPEGGPSPGRCHIPAPGPGSPDRALAPGKRPAPGRPRPPAPPAPP